MSFLQHATSTIGRPNPVLTESIPTENVPPYIVKMTGKTSEIKMKNYY